MSRITWPFGPRTMSRTLCAGLPSQYVNVAPSAGFSAAKNPCAMFETSSQYCITVARAGANRYVDFDAIAGDHSAMSDASSSTQRLRPCVASTRSFVRGWTRISSYRVVGRFAFSIAQCAPESRLTKTWRSVPAKTTFAFPGYSYMLRTEASPGSPFTTRVHVRPKSVVRAMYGAKSPERCESNATNAVPRDAPDATMRPTYVPL